MTDIGNIAESSKRNSKRRFSAGKTPTDEQLRRLLDKVANIEALLTELHFSAGSFSFDMTDFVEESFGNLQIAEKASEQSPEKAEEFEEEFEIDDEMREVFALEAEDLLRNISLHLEILEKAPNNREALLEIRRNAHTLKGSAGIVGLKNLSRLAHRGEDLLDTGGKRIEAVKLFGLLLASTRC